MLGLYHALSLSSRSLSLILLSLSLSLSLSPSLSLALPPFLSLSRLMTANRLDFEALKVRHAEAMADFLGEHRRQQTKAMQNVSSIIEQHSARMLTLDGSPPGTPTRGRATDGFRTPPATEYSQSATACRLHCGARRGRTLAPVWQDCGSTAVGLW